MTPHGRSRSPCAGTACTSRSRPTGWDGLRLVPPSQDGSGDGLLAELRRVTTQRGARLHGWTVFLDNTTLGLAHPDVTQENCFGDRAAPADLCPSHPDVRAYATALARSVARLGVEAVFAESLHFGFFGHGYHHERCFVELGPVEEFLLGLCFCGHCRARAGEGGVDAQAARAAAVRITGGVLDGGAPLPDELSPAGLAECADEDLSHYVATRTGTVTTLVAEVTRAVASEGSQLVFLDLAGAVKGYADGLPAGGLADEAAWQAGVDPAAVGAAADGYAILGYARDPARLSADAAAYRAALGESGLAAGYAPPGPAGQAVSGQPRGKAPPDRDRRRCRGLLQLRAVPAPRARPDTRGARCPAGLEGWRTRVRLGSFWGVCCLAACMASS